MLLQLFESKGDVVLTERVVIVTVQEARDSRTERFDSASLGMKLFVLTIFKDNHGNHSSPTFYKVNVPFDKRLRNNTGQTES